MAQAVSRHPLAVRTPFRSKDGPCEFSGVQGGTATDFFPHVFSLFPSHCHSTSAAHSSLSTCCSYQ